MFEQMRSFKMADEMLCILAVCLPVCVFQMSVFCTSVYLLLSVNKHPQIPWCCPVIHTQHTMYVVDSPRGCYWIYGGNVWDTVISGRDEISNCIPHYSMGCNNLSMPGIPAYGTAKILIWYEPEMRLIFHKELFDHVFQECWHYYWN